MNNTLYMQLQPSPHTQVTKHNTITLHGYNTDTV